MHYFSIIQVVHNGNILSSLIIPHFPSDVHLEGRNKVLTPLYVMGFGGLSPVLG